MLSSLPSPSEIQAAPEARKMTMKVKEELESREYNSSYGEETRSASTLPCIRQLQSKQFWNKEQEFLPGKSRTWWMWKCESCLARPFDMRNEAYHFAGLMTRETLQVNREVSTPIWLYESQFGTRMVSCPRRE